MTRGKLFGLEEPVLRRARARLNPASFFPGLLHISWLWYLTWVACLLACCQLNRLPSFFLPLGQANPFFFCQHERTYIYISLLTFLLFPDPPSFPVLCTCVHLQFSTQHLASCLAPCQFWDELPVTFIIPTRVRLYVNIKKKIETGERERKKGTNMEICWKKKEISLFTYVYYARA